jgi:fluoride exporter
MDQPPPRPRVEPDLLALIALGGALGATLRYAVDTWAPAAGVDGFPWATLGINVLGAFGLSALHVYVPTHPRLPRRVRAVLGAGVLGGFTTFSAYAEEARALLAGGHAVLALLYLLGTLAATVLAVEAARRVPPLRSRR